MSIQVRRNKYWIGDLWEILVQEKMELEKHILGARKEEFNNGWSKISTRIGIEVNQGKKCKRWNHDQEVNNANEDNIEQVHKTIVHMNKA
jgi:hypothetical protein